MQPKLSDAARKPSDLAGQYRPIGPAAVLAAILCAAKKFDKAETAPRTLGEPAKKAA